MASQAAFDQLETTLDTWSRDRDLSGAVLLTHRGATVFEGYYGLADRAAGLPVTPRTRFGLASVTKMYTAVTVAGLVADGRLDFDQRLVDVLPAAHRPSTLHEGVTVQHLLTHTSGIADYAEEDDESPLYMEDYGALWNDRPVYRMLRPLDFLPMFGDLPAYRPPGERWQYSNAGFILLGIVIEEVTGRAYTDEVTERVFTRAGMSGSGFFRLDEAVPDVAVGYRPRKSDEAPWRSNIYEIPVVGGPDGGAFSTTHDLDAFLTALTDGTLLGDLQDTVLTRYVDIGEGYAMGYGVFFRPNGSIGHGGGDPGVETYASRFRDEDLNAVVLCNMEDCVGDVNDLLLEAWRS